MACLVCYAVTRFFESFNGFKLTIRQFSNTWVITHSKYALFECLLRIEHRVQKEGEQEDWFFKVMGKFYMFSVEIQFSRRFGHLSSQIERCPIRRDTLEDTLDHLRPVRACFLWLSLICHFLSFTRFFIISSLNILLLLYICSCSLTRFLLVRLFFAFFTVLTSFCCHILH